MDNENFRYFVFFLTCRVGGTQKFGHNYCVSEDGSFPSEDYITDRFAKVTGTTGDNVVLTNFKEMSREDFCSFSGYEKDDKLPVVEVTH